MIKAHVQKVKEGEVDVIKYTENALKEIEKIDKEYNYFNVITKDLAISQAEQVSKKKLGRLAGVLISVKDCICVKDVDSKAGSSILGGYKPLFNATVIDKLIKEGAIIIGKTSQDEFGFGGFNTNVGLGLKTPKNPFDQDKVCGGSSGGSAGVVQKLKEFAHVSIAESTGGSIVNPASFCGVYGLCPTYGLISRYGLIDYANSLDKIGIMANSYEDVKDSLGVVEGFDHLDQTSLKQKREKNKDIKRVAILKEGLDVDSEVKEIFLDYVDKFGFKVDEVSMPFVKKYGIASYYVTALSEASTNLAKYCGMRYGAQENISGGFDEYFSKIRTGYFNDETKRRLIIGTFVRQSGYRDAYYLRAQKVRTKIISEYKKIFGKYDLILSPTMPVVAPSFSEVSNMTPLQNFMMDMLTVGPNLAGLPHLNVPCGVSKKLPVGMMAVADHLNEEKLLALGGIYV